MLLTFGQMMKNLKLDLAAARKLKWVQALGTGLDGITDQPALKPSVTVTSLHGVHGAPVSEAALASMLALSRDLPGFVRAQDEHQWKRWPAKLLHDKTVGILGIGVIAEALAPKCKAMGMTVVGITSSPRKVAGFDRVHPVGELLTVLPALDYLVLLTPYSPATHHMIDAKVFAAMKPTAIFVNVARGGVVDEDALIEALRDKKIAGAALDVFNQEPLPPDHPLWDFKNVIITTHQGGFCDTYVDLAMPILEHNMRCFLNGDLKGMMNVARRGAHRTPRLRIRIESAMANEHWKNFPPVRRVVTGHDANNVAKVLIDAPATNHKGAEGRSTLMWITDQNPADIGVGEKIEDMGARIVGTPPPPNGTRFCVIDFPPGNHPHMHRTETVDYVIVIDGEIEMDMDDSTVKLKQGDILVQRGTNHAWANRSGKNARVAFVLVDGKPLGIGKPVLGAEQPALTRRRRR